MTFRDLRNAILFLALVYIVIVFLIYIVDVILIFSITALIVITLNPLVNWAQKHRIPRGLSTAFLAIAFVGIVVGIMFYIVPLATDQFKQLARELPAIEHKIKSYFASIRARYPGLHLGMGGITIQSVAFTLLGAIGGAARITEDIILVISGAVIIFVTTIYTLINPEQLIDGSFRAVDAMHRPRLVAAAKRLSIQIRSWAFGVIISMITIFILTWLAMSLIGLKQAFLFGVIAGILELVPVVGPIMAAVPPIIVGLTVSPLTALWVIIAFIIIQQFENHVLIPMVMSRQVSLHPVTVIAWVLVMGSIYGIIGIFLATPAAVTAGLLYDELYLREYAKRSEDAGPRERGNDRD